eukprot:Stramenopile-MAST_4_protein_146
MYFGAVPAPAGAAAGFNFGAPEPVGEYQIRIEDSRQRSEGQNYTMQGSESFENIFRRHSRAAGTTYAAADTGAVADTGAEDTDTPPKLLRQNTGPHGHELIAAHLSQTKTEHGSIIGVLGAISAAHKSGAISDQRKAELKESLLSNSAARHLAMKSIPQFLGRQAPTPQLVKDHEEIMEDAKLTAATDNIGAMPHGPPEATCGICMDAIEPHASVLSCTAKHCFHANCLYPYINQCTFECAETAAIENKTFDWKRFARTKGNVECPAHLCECQFDARDVIVGTPGDLSKRVIGTILHGAEQSKKVADSQRVLMSLLGGDVNNYERRRMLKSAYPAAKMCNECSFGPMVNENCSDMITHAREANNCCPRCGWTASDWSEFPKWDGKLPEETKPSLHECHASASETLTSLCIRASKPVSNVTVGDAVQFNIHAFMRERTGQHYDYIGEKWEMAVVSSIATDDTLDLVCPRGLQIHNPLGVPDSAYAGVAFKYIRHINSNFGRTCWLYVKLESDNTIGWIKFGRTPSSSLSTTRSASHQHLSDAFPSKPKDRFMETNEDDDAISEKEKAIRSVKEKFLAKIDDMVHEMLKETKRLINDHKHTQFRQQMHQQQYGIDSGIERTFSNLTSAPDFGPAVALPAADVITDHEDGLKLVASNDKAQRYPNIIVGKNGCTLYKENTEDSDVVSTCTHGASLVILRWTTMEAQEHTTNESLIRRILRHDGEWRGARMGDWCKKKEGDCGTCICKHAMIVPSEHWSCCGQTSFLSTCKLTTEFDDLVVPGDIGINTQKKLEKVFADQSKHKADGGSPPLLLVTDFKIDFKSTQDPHVYGLPSISNEVGMAWIDPVSKTCFASSGHVYALEERPLMVKLEREDGYTVSLKFTVPQTWEAFKKNASLLAGFPVGWADVEKIDGVRERLDKDTYSLAIHRLTEKDKLICCRASPAGILLQDARVMARYRGTMYFPGIIAEVHPNGTYSVQFDDGRFDTMTLAHIQTEEAHMTIANPVSTYEEEGVTEFHRMFDSDSIVCSACKYCNASNSTNCEICNFNFLEPNPLFSDVAEGVKATPSNLGATNRKKKKGLVSGVNQYLHSVKATPSNTGANGFSFGAATNPPANEIGFAFGDVAKGVKATPSNTGGSGFSFGAATNPPANEIGFSFGDVAKGVKATSSNCRTRASSFS